MRFSELEKSFARIFVEKFNGGAAFALYVDGSLASEGFGGFSRGEEAWNTTTQATIFSCSKGLTTVLIGMLHDQGALDLLNPVARYWPQFRSISEELTVAEVMQHKAGLSAPRSSLSLEQALDQKYFAELLVKQEPLWKPGNGYSYHAFTFGTLLQEIVLRATDKTIGENFKNLIANPLQIATTIGAPVLDLPAQLFSETRVVPKAEIGSAAYWDSRALNLGGAFPFEDLGQAGKSFDDPSVVETELPGVNFRSSARDLAKIMSALVTETDGIRLLGPDTLQLLTEHKISTPAVFDLGNPVINRATGFMLSTPGYREFLSDHSFGHDGLGGQLVMADKKHRIGFSYVTNHLGQGETEQSGWQELVSELKNLFD